MAPSTPKKGAPIEIHADKCTGCLTCQLRCSMLFEGAFALSQARIDIERLVGASREYDVTLAKDCDFCGICVRYCMYGALVQETREEVEP